MKAYVIGLPDRLMSLISLSISEVANILEPSTSLVHRLAASTGQQTDANLKMRASIDMPSWSLSLRRARGDPIAMFYAPRATASVTTGLKSSCDMFLACTTNMRHRTIVSMSTHLPQPRYLRASPDQAPVLMLNSRRPIVIAGQASEV